MVFALIFRFRTLYRDRFQKEAPPFDREGFPAYTPFGVNNNSEVKPERALKFEG
jgi:hypothetical protein